MSSSLVRARRAAEAPGSGGKIMRVRRAATATSPYARPKSPLPSPTEPENPKWIFGFIAPATRMISNGAGKLISLVFGSGESASSSDDDGNDDDSEDDDNDDDDDICSQECEELHENTKAFGAKRDGGKSSQPIVQRSETKVAIEQLLLQETFSRDECVKLTKIIQSRVVDSPSVKETENGTQIVLHNRTVSSGVAFPGPWQSPWQTRKSSEAFPYSPSGLNALFPGASPLQAHMPDLRSSAVMEAKKWFEEKKLESSSNSERDYGPCTLNTVMSPNVDDEVGSPVDVAKSYMRARPPWASPSLSNVGFKTPPPIGTNLYKDTSHAIAGHSLPSSKVLKRNSLDIGSWNTSYETRNVRLKSKEGLLEPLVSKQIDSLGRTVEVEARQMSSVADKRELEVVGKSHDTNSLQATESVDAPVKLPTELAVNDDHPDGVLCVSDKRSVEVNIPLNGNDSEGDHPMPVKASSDSIKNMIAENQRHGVSSSATTLPKAMHSGLGNEVPVSNSTISIAEKNQDFGEAQLTKELSGSVSDQSLIPDSMSAQHNGTDIREVVLDLEPEGVPLEEIKCSFPSDAGDVTSDNNAHTSSQQIISPHGKIVQAEISLELHQMAVPKEKHTISDSRLPGGNDQKWKEASNSRSRISTNGSTIPPSSSSAETNADPSLRLSDNGHQNQISLSDGVESCELLTEAAIEVPPTDEINSIQGGPQKGISKKSGLLTTRPRLNSNRGLAEKPNAKVDKRGKEVARYRRGRGRGK